MLVEGYPSGVNNSKEVSKFSPVVLCFLLVLVVVQVLVEVVRFRVSTLTAASVKELFVVQS